jgi:acetyl-CoA carboxylase carboxyltransferase component
MRELLDSLLDAGSLLEIHERWAKELIVGFARLDGRAIGIVANQPKVKGGVLFVDSSDKARASSGRATPSTSRCCSSPTSPAS